MNRKELEPEFVILAPAPGDNLISAPRLPTLTSSVADPDPGSGAFLTPGSGIRDGFFPDPGSRIPRPYFEELFDHFFGQKFYNSLKIGPIFFFSTSKLK